MTKTKRALALSAAVAILVVMLLSAAYIVHEADHRCIGEGCSICYQISVFIGTLKTLSLAVVATAFTAVLTRAFALQPAKFHVGVPTVTLVTLKVKLST